MDGGVDEDDAEDEDDLEISLHALTGWSAAQTMRVLVKIGTMEVIALVDSGSTHNFVSDKFAEILKLPATQIKPSNVRVANGGHLQCSGKFEHVPLLVQGISFAVTLYSLPLMGLDMVLGVQWLKELGDVNCNWKNLTMKFHWDGQLRILKGINSKPIQSCSSKEMAKELRHGSSIFAACFQLQQESPPEEIHPDMLQLLN